MSDEELKQGIDDVGIIFPTHRDAIGHHISHGQPLVCVQVYEAFLNGSIKVPGKDLCDMSGNQEGRTPDQFTLYNVMLPRVYHPALQGNLYEQRCKVGLLCRQIYKDGHQVRDMCTDQALLHKPLQSRQMREVVHVPTLYTNA